MTSFYLNPPSPFPLVEGSQGQDHLLFTLTSETFSSSSPIYFKATQELGDYDGDHQEHRQQPQRHKLEADFQFSTGSSDHGYNNICIKPSSIVKREDVHSDPCDNAPIKWMSSKMRIMRKMMNSDRTVNNKLTKECPIDQNNSTNTVIRVCSDCNTTKTPLWRSGPRGPKSLCNACGIRQRKARRAMAAATAAASGGMVSSDPSMNSEMPKEKSPDSNCTTQYKKKCKVAGPRTKKQLQFDDFIVSLSKNSSFHQVFPQDERDAAILLMALSCGLVRS